MTAAGIRRRLGHLLGLNRLRCPLCGEAADSHAPERLLDHVDAIAAAPLYPTGAARGPLPRPAAATTDPSYPDGHVSPYGPLDTWPAGERLP